MPRAIRATTTGRLFLAFGILIVILAIHAFMISGYLDTIDERFSIVAAVEEPTSKAVEDMETSLSEIGTGVLDYLATGAPAERERVLKARQDFAHFERGFEGPILRLPRTRQGVLRDTLYADYLATAATLMTVADEERQVHERLGETWKGLQPLLTPLVLTLMSSGNDIRQKTPLVELMTRATYARAAWFGAYLSTSDPTFRNHFVEENRTFQRASSMYRALRLTPDQTRWNADIGRRFAQRGTLMTRGMDLHDQLERGRVQFRSQRDSLHNLIDAEQAQARQNFTEGKVAAFRRIDFVRTVILVLFIAGLLVGLITAVTLGSSIVGIEKSLVQERQEAERRAAELSRITRALVSSNRELDQFAYVASHDLKAPLRAVRNLTHWIEEDLKNQMTPESQKNMALIHDRVERMERMIDGLLNYSRVRGRGQVELVDVGALVREIVELLAPPGNIRIEIAPDLPRIETDRLPLQQVFLNLLSNALRFANSDAGEIRVSSRNGQEGLAFCVADNGPGVARGTEERIWRMFQSQDPSGKGTGIGLAVVKKHVEEHGGRAWVESKDGQGAEFWFTWPDATAPAAL
ncbi:MAG: sensor histidine kinase [Candidatus Eiseniibacteriota bacterium]